MVVLTRPSCLLVIGVKVLNIYLELLSQNFVKYEGLRLPVVSASRTSFQVTYEKVPLRSSVFTRLQFPVSPASRHNEGPPSRSLLFSLPVLSPSPFISSFSPSVSPRPHVILIWSQNFLFQFFFFLD